MLLALYVSVGRELLPLLDDYAQESCRPACSAAWAWRYVSSGSDGQWHGLSPTLAAHQVQLGEGDDRLLLERIELRPIIPASLLPASCAC